MQYSLLWNNQNNLYQQSKVSQSICNMKMVNAVHSFSRKENVHQPQHLPQDRNESIESQKRKNGLQKKEEKQIYRCNEENTSVRCPSCARWKDWALQQQKMLLQLQKQITMKEENIQKIIQSLKREINEKNNRKLYIQQSLQQKISQVNTIQQSLSVANQKLKEIQQISRIQEASKKQNKIDTFTEKSLQSNTIQPICLNDLQTINKIKNLTKDSTVISKTEGSQYFQPIKQKFEKQPEYVKKAQLQKYIFQNQALKDYNAMLVERLKMSKYKKCM